MAPRTLGAVADRPVSVQPFDSRPFAAGVVSDGGVVDEGLFITERKSKSNVVKERMYAFMGLMAGQMPCLKLLWAASRWALFDVPVGSPGNRLRFENRIDLYALHVPSAKRFRYRAPDVTPTTSAVLPIVRINATGKNTSPDAPSTDLGRS